MNQAKVHANLLWNSSALWQSIERKHRGIAISRRAKLRREKRFFFVRKKRKSRLVFNSVGAANYVKHKFSNTASHQCTLRTQKGKNAKYYL
jgi:hypothetical protein